MMMMMMMNSLARCSSLLHTCCYAGVASPEPALLTTNGGASPVYNHPVRRTCNLNCKAKSRPAQCKQDKRNCKESQFIRRWFPHSPRAQSVPFSLPCTSRFSHISHFTSPGFASWLVYWVEWYKQFALSNPLKQMHILKVPPYSSSKIYRLQL